MCPINCKGMATHQALGRSISIRVTLALPGRVPQGSRFWTRAPRPAFPGDMRRRSSRCRHWLNLGQHLGARSSRRRRDCAWRRPESWLRVMLIEPLARPDWDEAVPSRKGPVGSGKCGGGRALRTDQPELAPFNNAARHSPKVGTQMVWPLRSGRIAGDLKPG